MSTNHLIQVPCLECDEDVRFRVAEHVIPADEESVYSGILPRKSYLVTLVSQSCGHEQSQLTLDIISRLQSGTPLEEIERNPHPVPGTLENLNLPEDYRAQLEAMEELRNMPTERLGALNMEAHERAQVTPPGEGGVILMDTFDDSEEFGGDSPGLEIFEVYYKRLHSFPGYENEEIGARAQVPIGEDPWAVLDRLKAEVTKRFEDVNEAEQITSDIRHLDARKREMLRDIAEMRATWTRLRKVLETIGVDTNTIRERFTQEELDSLPF